jgi:hypothetical protein
MATRKAAKKTPKADKTAGEKKPKGPGVISTIIECISKDKGASADEIVAVLTKAFPNREPESMRKTVLIQAAKNCSSKEIHETRGRIYFTKR